MGRSSDDRANVYGSKPVFNFVSPPEPVKVVKVQGNMPGHTYSDPKFPSRTDGYEKGLVAGTIKVTCG
jgi:hypothetical protein